MSLAKPARNEQYANYLFGLGIGMLIGGFSFRSKDHHFLLICSGIILLLAIVVFYLANTKGKK